MTLQPAPKDTAAARTLDWRHILPVFVIVCTYAAGTAAVLPVLPFHIRAMGGSPLVLGIVIAAEAVGQFISAPALGQLSDRFGRKRILMASQIVSAASLLLLALAPNVAIILIARAMFGLTAGNISVTAAYIADHTDAGDRRRAMGILMGGRRHRRDHRRRAFRPLVRHVVDRADSCRSRIGRGVDRGNGPSAGKQAARPAGR